MPPIRKQLRAERHEATFHGFPTFQERPTEHNRNAPKFLAVAFGPRPRNDRGSGTAVPNGLWKDVNGTVFRCGEAHETTGNGSTPQTSEYGKPSGAEFVTRRSRQSKDLTMRNPDRVLHGMGRTWNEEFEGSMAARAGGSGGPSN